MTKKLEEKNEELGSIEDEKTDMVKSFSEISEYMESIEEDETKDNA